MPSLTVGDADSPLRIVVTPSQSSYFAGEPFSVKITFTNTRTVEASPASRPSSHGHRRNAHSISSAPLAQPPTSPGNPRSAMLAPTSKAKAFEDLPRKKGFIGKTAKPFGLPQGAEQLPDLIEQRRKRQLAPKSLSVSISPYELEESLSAVSSAHSQKSFFQTAPSTPSPLSRTDSLALASDHPHARKQSVLDGQLSLDILSPTTSIPPSPYTPSSSQSTFSLVLDPIAEASHFSPYPSTPSLLASPTIEPASFAPHAPSSNSVYAYPPRYPRPSIGLGHPPPSPRGQPRSAFATTFPHTNHELILYSYAQLTGTLVLSSVPGALASTEQVQTLNAVRSALLNRVVLGGGSMDISSSLSPNATPVSPRTPGRHRPTHSRSSSFSAGLLSILSPTSLVSSLSSPNTAATKWRSTSGYTPTGTPLSARFPNSASSPSMLGLASEDVDPDAPLPTLEVQPSMLAVDLSLAPGESRTYTYSIKLPDNLPPTFRGKALKFSYEFVIGTCRAASAPTTPGASNPNGAGGVGANSISRVMKVPIRVYNHVSVGRVLRPYDILWPVNKRMDIGMPGTEAVVVEESKESGKGVVSIPQLPTSASTPVFPTSNTLDSLRDYARSLLASFPEPQTNGNADKATSDDSDGQTLVNGNGDANGSVRANGHTNGNGSAAPVPKRTKSSRYDELRRTESEREKEAEGGLTGCREAVEIMTRNPKKASYDVNKDGVKVAVLTFTKSAYRLGETITGVVELNDRFSRARVLKVSAILESHETLPSSISPPANARHLRRSHAESHSSFTLNTLRTTFSLDIPSDASPAFQVRVGSDAKTPGSTNVTGGLEWKVRLCLLVGVASQYSHRGVQGVRFRSLQRDGERGEWGSAWIATEMDAPLEKPDLKAEREALREAQRKTNALLQHQERQRQQQMTSPRGWGSFFVSSILYGGADENTEREYHDGDALASDDGDEYDADDRTGKVDVSRGMAVTGVGSGVEYDGIIPDMAGGVGVGVDYEGGSEGWKEVKLETVECEVPVKVFPGNTAFMALDVVFDV